MTVSVFTRDAALMLGRCYYDAARSLVQLKGRLKKKPTTVVNNRLPQEGVMMRGSCVNLVKETS